MFLQQITCLSGIILAIFISISPKAEAAVINECTKAILRKTKAIPYARMVIDKDGIVLDSDLKLGYTEDIIENTEIQICDSIVLSTDNDDKGGPGSTKPPVPGSGSSTGAIVKADPLAGFVKLSPDQCLTMAMSSGGLTHEQISSCQNLAELLTGMKTGGKPGKLTGGTLTELFSRVVFPAMTTDRDLYENMKTMVMDAIYNVAKKFADLGGSVMSKALNDTVASLGAQLVLEFGESSSVYWGYDESGNANFLTVLTGKPMRSPKSYTGTSGTELSINARHIIYVKFAPSDMQNIFLAIIAGQKLQDIPGVTITGVFSVFSNAYNDATSQSASTQANCFWVITGGKAKVSCY